MITVKVWNAFLALRKRKNKRAHRKASARAERKLNACIEGKWMDADTQLLVCALRAEL